MNARRAVGIAALCFAPLSLMAADKDGDDVAVAAVDEGIFFSGHHFDGMAYGANVEEPKRDGQAQSNTPRKGPTASELFQKKWAKEAATDIQFLDRQLALTDSQQRKLKVAANGDIAQHIQRAEELRPKLTNKRLTQREYLELSDQLRSLQAPMAVGLFREHSLFRKTLRHILTAEQQAQYAALRRGRQAEVIQAALRRMEKLSNGGLTLSPETKRQFQDVLFEHGRLPHDFGGWGQQIVFLEANLHRGRIKPLLTADEWQMFELLVGLAKNNAPTLESCGIWSAHHPRLDELEADDDTKGEQP